MHIRDCALLIIPSTVRTLSSLLPVQPPLADPAELMADPYGVYARLREAGPVHRITGTDGLPALDANLLNMEGPDHTRIRRLVQQTFAPRRSALLRDPIVTKGSAGTPEPDRLPRQPKGRTGTAWRTSSARSVR